MIQKKMLLKSKYIIIFLLIIAIFVPIFVSAKIVLESGIPGQVEPGAPLPGLTDYMRYVYWFLLGTVGIAAFVSLVWYGVLWIYSGIVEQKSEALEGIKNTFLGLVFAFSAYIILYTINPDLVSLRAPEAPVPSVTTSPKTSTPLEAPTKPVTPTINKSFAKLAGDITDNKSSFLSTPGTRWPSCQKSASGPEITPDYTIRQLKVGEKANICGEQCARNPDDKPYQNDYCTKTGNISTKMIEAIWQVAYTQYPSESKPSFSIIEIVGGDRPTFPKTAAHYNGKAIDIIPTVGTSANEYNKIISAFNNTNTGAKASCVDKDDNQSYTDCANKNVDHLHIEW